MPNLDELKLELDDALTLKMISQAFTEASAAKLAKIRANFEKNKEFYQEISFLYHLVQVNAKKAKVKSKKADREKGGKSLYVAITSNQRFYGNINLNIMRKFAEDAEKKQDIDLCVIGGTGRDYLRGADFRKKYQEQVFAKDYPTEKEAKAFLEYIKPYKKVYLYYPQFKSLVRQEVGVVDITQTSETVKVKDDEINILFEPELSKIYDFFQIQIRSIVFFRIMMEADLARTAARLLTMSAAEERSNETIKNKKMQIRKIQLSVLNAKLLETFSSMVGVKK